MPCILFFANSIDFFIVLLVLTEGPSRVNAYKYKSSVRDRRHKVLSHTSPDDDGGTSNFPTWVQSQAPETAATQFRNYCCCCDVYVMRMITL